MSKSHDLLDAITADIRAVQAREENERFVLLGLAEKRSVSRKYNLVELGWLLLRLKEGVEHGNEGNQHASKNKTETVSVLFSEGFVAAVEKLFSIGERSAENYMNAARNAGLTAESTAEEVAALRAEDALAGKLLTKLYLPPGTDKPAPLTPQEEVQQQMRFAYLRLMSGKQSLLGRLHAEIMEEALPAFLPPDHIEDLYHKLSEAAEKVGAMRQTKRRTA